MPAAAALLTALLALLALPVSAHDYHAGPLHIDHPWARASIGEAGNSALYMTITNAGDAPDALTAVKTDVAANVMLHESRMENGVVKMVHLDEIAVPAHGTSELKPLGLHVMLMGLKRPLKDGEMLPVTLVFTRQGEVKVEAKIEKGVPGSRQHDHR
jgi:copper(I)-binding protein